MRLYGRDSRRLYLNAHERERFIEAADAQPAHIRAFCLTLLFTGCRLSEARALTHEAVQVEEGLVAVRSLKKRSQLHVREIPVPIKLTDMLARLGGQPTHAYRPNSQPIWTSATGLPLDRITAYRWVKRVMHSAEITGLQACPKGLRHAFGIHAVRSGIQLNMIQKWMGHASIKTTAIYTNAVGPEEIALAAKMWRSKETGWP